MVGGDHDGTGTASLLIIIILNEGGKQSPKGVEHCSV